MGELTIRADRHVGKRIRERRGMMGLTQQGLAEALEITYQQLQKYETGADRISASLIWDIAAAMEVPVLFFFEGLDGQPSHTGEARGDVFTDKETLDLVRT